MDKKLLRRNIKRRILELDEQLKKEKGQSLSKQLASLLESINSEKGFTKLGVFTPMSDEPVWFGDSNWIEQWDLQIVHMGRELSFHPVTKEDFLSLGTCLELPERLLQTKEVPDIVLVPGLAFTRHRERLGRGKGFYDRFLADFKGISIGVFFSDCEETDVCTEEHDFILDYIVTDIEIIRRPNK